MSRTTLVVEDEQEIADLLRFHLEREGFAVRVVGSGRAALTQAQAQQPDLVLLDLMLPDVDGLEVCRRLKRTSETQDIPIMIVSAKGEEADVVAGIELGADDYVTKPFSPRVLVARAKNILRRYDEEAPNSNGHSANTTTIAEGALVIDADRHAVMVHGNRIDLTVTEFGILQCLARRPGFVRTRDQIIANVHGDSTVLSSRTVDVHVTALRRKLGEVGGMIQTVRGVGYRLSDAALAQDE